MLRHLVGLDLDLTGQCSGSQERMLKESAKINDGQSRFDATVWGGKCPTEITEDNERKDEALALNIGKAVIARSKEIFEKCGAKDDWCLQSTDDETVWVFGGTNRVIYSVKLGIWKYDPSYCTPTFIENWQDWQDWQEATS
jgi:hypothetical protein